MKNGKCFIGVLVVLVFMFNAAECFAQKSANIPDALTVIHSRKSVRTLRARQ